MTRTIFILIGTFIYLWSMYNTYNFIRIAYSKNGKWDADPNGPQAVDAIVVIAPILNTLFYVSVLLAGMNSYSPEYQKEKPRNQFLNKLFKVKR